MTNRTIRVNELVQRELGLILRKNYQSEAVAITISQVRISPDLHDGRVDVSIVGDEETVTQKLRWLRSVAPAIRQELGRRIVLKFLPKLEYRVDESTGRNLRVQELLDEIVGSPPSAPDNAGPASS